METVQDYRHTEAWEGLWDSKELQTIIPLVTYVQTLRKNDTEQNSTNHHLIKEQAGFRPGKTCTSQLLNITQHIEDGYQESMITGTVFVDLSAAYAASHNRMRDIFWLGIRTKLVLPRLGASRKESLQNLHTHAMYSDIHRISRVLKERSLPITDEEQILNRRQR